MTSIAIAVVVLPLLVSVVICAVARREGLPVPAGPLTRLLVATVVAAVSSLLFSRLLVAVAMFAVLFIAFAIPVMQALERSAGARVRIEDTRSALLVPRTVSAYVLLPARVTLAVAVVASLAWVVVRAMTIAPNRMTMLLGLTVAGLTFFGLYEAWMRQEVFDVRAIDDKDRRLRVRAVFAAQIVLTLSFLLMAALSAGPWPGRPVLAVAATIIGGIGCAFALSTGIQQRYLEAWTATRETRSTK
ncbi:MAG TPA: hypothetical protein VGQ36_04315 [Thermoanaerobaculia bacterium]|nr:hypothetical protein [Thermoanaerobaculia bacterium]